jgi:uncharacterized membrane protein YedE/YeeE
VSALLASFFCGVVFSLGLGFAGMTRPSKVIGFLDFAGAWDPSLAMVMVGAIAVYAVAYHARRERPLLADAFTLPSRTEIDPRLLGGAALFGVGWGLAGFCPGPAVTSLASGQADPVFFVAAMVAGMLAHDLLLTRPASETAAIASLVLDARHDA